MTREIKFRAWDKTPGLEPRMLNDFGYGSEEQRYGVNENLKRYIEHPNWVIMQYTGLKDKNGKGVYEGDIICKYDIVFGHVVTDVKWTDFEDSEWGYGIGVGFNFHQDDTKEFEIIGNIYENPELLTNPLTS